MLRYFNITGIVNKIDGLATITHDVRGIWTYESQ